MYLAWYHYSSNPMGFHFNGTCWLTLVHRHQEQELTTPKRWSLPAWWLATPRNQGFNYQEDCKMANHLNHLIFSEHGLLRCVSNILTSHDAMKSWMLSTIEWNKSYDACHMQPTIDGWHSWIHHIERCMCGHRSFSVNLQVWFRSQNLDIPLIGSITARFDLTVNSKISST